MHFRHARHTSDLGPMISFYTEVVGLELLGNFENHDGYDGVFLGFPNQNWELEFTVSSENPGHIPDEDDALVFYFPTEAQIHSVLKEAVNRGIHPVKNKNPYWNVHAQTIPDPDGFNVILALRSPKLTSEQKLTQLVISLGISDWNALVVHVRDLPYGRNENRRDFGLVLSEQKGSCSSKHALLKAIADENQIDVKLIVGIYEMDKSNTPGIGNVLPENHLEAIPEAHCYLKMNGKRFDFTNPHSDISKIENHILTEVDISPEQVADFKVEFHKDFIRKWLRDQNIDLTFDDIWNIREQCIFNLSANT